MIKQIVIFIISIFDYYHNKKILNFLKKEITELNLLFDIGAHKGETIKLFLNNIKICKIVSFEASPQNFNVLKKKALVFKKKNKNTKIILENIALGGEKKNEILNQMLESSSSSIKKLNINSNYFKHKLKALNLSNDKKLFKRIDIKLETLSDYIKKKNYTKIDFIKIDTEGYEYEILKGLKNKIKIVKYIMLEHHYDNMIVKNYTFSDIKNLMDRNNFKLIFKAKMPLRKTFEYIYINEKDF